MSAHAEPAKHIHLPSVHVRSDDAAGFDYEEDLFILATGRVARMVRLVIVKDGSRVVRETFGELCSEELEEIEGVLPVLMDEGSLREEEGRRIYIEQRLGRPAQG